MKKLHLICAMSLLALVSLVSCQNPHKEADAVAAKLEAKETLTQPEIGEIIKYVGEYAQKAQGDVDSIVNDQDTPKVKVDMEKLNKEYVNINLFKDYLKSLDFTTLDDSNLQLIAKYAHYEEFVTPPGMDFSVDPKEKAAGLEVQTPDSAANGNGVIATGVDTVEVKK